MANLRGHVLPVYFLASESKSMARHISQMNNGLKLMHEALRAEPRTAAKIRVSVLGFSDDVKTRLHLADLRSAEYVPELVARGGANYGAAFAHLISQIPTDVKKLKADFAVHRPAIVFFSDSRPSDVDWHVNRTRLVDWRQVYGAPNIIACGIGETDAKMILEIATSPDFAYVAMPDEEADAAIIKFCAALTKCLVTSGRTIGSGNDELIFDVPEGFRMALDAM